MARLLLEQVIAKLPPGVLVVAESGTIEGVDSVAVNDLLRLVVARSRAAEAGAERRNPGRRLP